MATSPCTGLVELTHFLCLRLEKQNLGTARRSETNRPVDNVSEGPTDATFGASDDSSTD